MCAACKYKSGANTSVPAHLKADLSRWEDRATFRPFLSTRAGQQTNDREEDRDRWDRDDNCEDNRLKSPNYQQC